MTQDHQIIPEGQQEEDPLRGELRGGLKGRLRSTVNTVDITLEALTDFLRSNLEYTAYEKAAPLLGEVELQMAQLGRLVDYAADAALGSALPQIYIPQIIDLIEPLRFVCDLYNEETNHWHSPARAHLACGENDLLPALGDNHMFSAMLVNLLSNAMQAKPDVTVTFSCAPDQLIYHDDGPGLPADAAALLVEGVWTKDLLERGGVGLLLIHQYAAAMGWRIRLERPQEGGTTLIFELPPCIQPDQPLTLQSDAVARQLYKPRCRAILHRELMVALNINEG